MFLAMLHIQCSASYEPLLSGRCCVQIQICMPLRKPPLVVHGDLPMFLGIFHFPAIHDYWRTNGIAPVALLFTGLMTRDHYIVLQK